MYSYVDKVEFCVWIRRVVFHQFEEQVCENAGES